METVKKVLDKVMKAQDYESCEDFIAAGLIDSMGIINLVDELEYALKITISGRDIALKNFKNTDAIMALVKKYVGGNSNRMK